MSRPVLRRAVAAAVLPLALASLSACGSDDSDKAGDTSSSSSSSSSGGSTADTPSAGETVDPADFVDRFQNGFENTTTAHETMTMSMGSRGSMTGEGDIDYRDGSPAMDMTMSIDQAGGDVQVILVDNVFYMKAPGMGGDKYLKMDLDDPNSPLGSLGSQLDPQEALKSFGEGVKTVTYVGEDGGEDQYTVTVDTAKMLDSLGEDAAGAAGAGMPDEISYVVWLDGEDRVTKMTIDLGKTGTMEMELSDFGKDVSIEAPPADQVAEMPSMDGSSMG
jgi:hypothetical protein